MRRCVLFLTVGLLLLTPTAAAQSGPSGPTTPGGECGAAFPAYDPEPVADGRTESTVEITMSDGVVLRATLALPTGPGVGHGPFPTAVTITGYNRIAGIGGDLARLVELGYAAVVLDDRGTGTSGGGWDSWGPRTRQDYTEVLDWIVAQPWSDGRIGLTGGSYLGITALFAAATGHPAVEAVFATVPMADAYRDIVFAGGEINAAFIPLWMGLVTAQGARPDDGTDPTVDLEHLANVASFQAPTVADAALGGATAHDGPFWRQRSPIDAVPDIPTDVPTFIVGGLDDIFQRGEPLLYEALAAQGNDARLLLGPWTHGSVGDGLPADGVPRLRDLLVQWFDAHVRGFPTGADCVPQVTQFVRGDDRYRSADSWPVPDLRADRWYLRGDGTLTHDAPVAAEPPRTYLQLPLNGICTRSANQWLIGMLDGTSCPGDNRLDEATALTWTSNPVDEPLTINGPIQADVWVSTVAPEAIVSVALSDVAPDGTSRGLTNGLLLSRHRAVDPARSRTLDGESIQPWHPFTEEATQPTPLLEPVLLPVEVFPTSATIRPGHRLRVTIAAFDVPHALPPLAAAVPTAAGVTSVLSDPEHPTSVVLPVVGPTTAVQRAEAARVARPATPTGAAAPAAAPAAPVVGGAPLARTGGAAPVPVLAALALAVAALLVRRQLAP